MSKFRYELNHGAKKTLCPQCGQRRFRGFVDTKTGEEADEKYGICDRVNECAYFLYPTPNSNEQFVPSQRKRMTPPKRTDWRCPEEVLAQTRDHRYNVFAWWIVNTFGEAAKPVLRAYRIGTYPQSQRHPHLAGATIFFQIGEDGKERAGKVIPYDQTGHRVKEHGASWLHSLLWGKSMEELGIGQVIFGGHLLKDRPDATCVVVESEKSAIICAIMYPEYVWVATGGSSNLTTSMCLTLADRNVIIIPDSGMYEEWLAKSLDIEPLCQSLVVSDHLEAIGLPKGDDIADLLLTGEGFVFPEIVSVETYVVGTGFVEPTPERQRIDAWTQNVSATLSPVDRILARPGVMALVKELDLDIERVTVKPL